MNKNKIKKDAFGFLKDINKKIRTKFDNISSKTGQYNVPDELFQKRTSRKNRVLISWKTVKDNELTIDMLKAFKGGVAVEFVNDDFFASENQSNPTFLALKERLGSDEVVSSIITIRSESGSSSSAEQRSAFEKLTNNLRVNYKGQSVIITKDNYKNYAIKQLISGGTGNEKWTGFLYVSIKGGQQDTIESHDECYTIFNPACEFANAEVCLDIDLVMVYFAFISIKKESLSSEKLKEYEGIMRALENALANSHYESGNLLDYCRNHPSMKMISGKLYDPIQAKEIDILDFAVSDKGDSKNIDFTHNEAVELNKFYWDSVKQTILSPARPMNVFWSKHFSNMMQQDLTLDAFFKQQKDMVKRREELLRNKINV